ALYGVGLSGWLRALADTGIDVGRYLSEKDEGYVFPWDSVVDVGVDGEKLKELYVLFKGFEDKLTKLL
ncbi:MAG: hypothetical protein N3E44_06320, partial [Candidatus Bathyarchaeota archaeon]|nr:hypothetical protein [Candidatus Bathyarchaeota archaeon]